MMNFFKTIWDLLVYYGEARHAVFLARHAELQQYRAFNNK